MNVNLYLIYGIILCDMGPYVYTSLPSSNERYCMCLQYGEPVFKLLIYKVQLNFKIAYKHIPIHQ